MLNDINKKEQCCKLLDIETNSDINTIIFNALVFSISGLSMLILLFYQKNDL